MTPLPLSTSLPRPWAVSPRFAASDSIVVASTTRPVPPMERQPAPARMPSPTTSVSMPPPKPSPPPTSNRLNQAGLAITSYTAAHALKFIPNQQTYPGGLLSADPLQWGRAGLGILAVNQLNKALNWQPPGWAKALETVAVLHTVLMGFEQKHLPHLLLAGGLSASLIAIGQAVDGQTDQWLARNPRPEKQKALIDTGIKTALVAGMLGATLALYPKAYVAFTRSDWTKWITGEVAHAELKSNTFEALLGKKDTDVSDRIMKANVANPELPEAWQDVASVKAYISHHTGAGKAIRNHWQLADALLEGKLPLKGAVQSFARKEQQKLQLADSLFLEPTPAHQLSPEQHQGIRALLDALHPMVDQLGQWTFEQDFIHFDRLNTTFKQHLPALQAVGADWQHLLMRMPEIAEHQATHAPMETPLVSVLGTEALTALTCRNGCCASALCMGDVAEGMGALVNGASGKAVVAQGGASSPSTQDNRTSSNLTIARAMPVVATISLLQPNSPHIAIP